MTGEVIKLIAIVCMLVDHVAWAWVTSDSALGILMHCVGRITMPVMTFMIAEGYEHTHDFKRYAGRLLIFAFVSDIPFMAFERSNLNHDVMFTLFFGLLAIWFVDHAQKFYIAIFSVIMIMGVALYFRVDWSFIGVLLCLLFWQFRANFIAMSISVVIMALLAVIVYGQWWQISLILSLPILRLYNGERDRGSKWGFYAFYPGHLAVLAILRSVIS
jgi:hypothetical protein